MLRLVTTRILKHRVFLQHKQTSPGDLQILISDRTSAGFIKFLIELFISWAASSSSSVCLSSTEFEVQFRRHMNFWLWFDPNTSVVLWSWSEHSGSVLNLQALKDDFKQNMEKQKEETSGRVWKVLSEKLLKKIKKWNPPWNKSLAADGASAPGNIIPPHANPRPWFPAARRCFSLRFPGAFTSSPPRNNAQERWTCGGSQTHSQICAGGTSSRVQRTENTQNLRTTEADYFLCQMIG